jgi:hypothetical protein
MEESNRVDDGVWRAVQERLGYMPVMTRMMWLVMERIYEGVDPRPTFYFGDCDDVGLECGGLGKVRLETKVSYDAL